MHIFVAVYLLSNFVYMLALENIMRGFFEKRRTSFVVMALSYLLYFALSSIVFLSLRIPIVTIIVFITTLFVITLNYESSTKRRIGAVFCAIAIFITVDLLAVLFTGIQQADAFDTVELDNVFGIIILGSVFYLFALMFRRFRNIRKSTITLPLFLVSILGIPILSLVIIFLTYIYLPPSASIMALAVMLGINVLAFYLHDILSIAYEDKLKSALYIQEKELYFSQIQLMQDSVKKVRSVRHDINLHLATIKELSIGNNTTTDYINSLLGDISESEVYSSTGNIAFDSIINFKLKTAKEENIKLDLSLFIPPVINIEIADIVTILGNLLDNALDAVAKVEDKMIKLDIEFSKSNLHIKIENSFDGIIKYTEGKDENEKRITTLKVENEHGYGLENIRKSVEKYNGHMGISYEGKMFSVGILLYVGV